MQINSAARHTYRSVLLVRKKTNNNLLIYKHKLIEHTETEGKSYKYVNPCSYSVCLTIRNSAQLFFCRTYLKIFFLIPPFKLYHFLWFWWFDAINLNIKQGS